MVISIRGSLKDNSRCLQLLQKRLVRFRSTPSSTRWSYNHICIKSVFNRWRAQTPSPPPRISNQMPDIYSFISLNLYYYYHTNHEQVSTLCLQLCLLRLSQSIQSRTPQKLSIWTILQVGQERCLRYIGFEDGSWPHKLWVINESAV